MPPLNLTTLPLEIQYNVCEILDETYRPSVRSFALASKHCRLAANQVLFRNICLDVQTGKQLLYENVNRLSASLEATDSFRHVHRLVVQMDYIYSNTVTDLGDSPSPVEINESWKPLAALITRLRALNNLHFCDRNRRPFPPCLLTAVEQTSCRLHLPYFALDSVWLDWPTNFRETGRVALSPGELAVVTSPRLYAIGIYVDWMSAQKVIYSQEALLELVKGYSPGLKEVTCTQRPDSLSENSLVLGQMIGHRERERWPGLLIERPTTQGPAAKGALTSLTMGVVRGIRAGREAYQDWDKCTNFEVLRTLIMHHCPTEETFRWMAGNLNLASLSSVELRLYGTGPGGDEFLCSLPSLSTLRLSIVHRMRSRDLSEIPLAIFETHGHVLRSLKLHSTLLPKHLDAIQAHCPALEHLQAVIRRSEGNVDEVAIYRRLGSHPRLESISLTLDCTVWMRETVKFDDAWGNKLLDSPVPFISSLRNGDVRQSLVNCAVDEDLAAAIFSCIAAAKPAGASPLKRITTKLRNAGIVFMFVHGASSGESNGRCQLATKAPIFDSFCREMVVSRHPRDDCPGEVLVEQLLADIRTRRTDAKAKQLLKMVGRVFRVLWPKCKPDDPKNDWRSLPLAE